MRWSFRGRSPRRPSFRARCAALAVLTLGFTALPESVEALPSIESVSLGTRDSNPDLAYNPAQASWFVVWREAQAGSPTTARIMGRLVHRGGFFLGNPVQVEGYRRDTGHPRIAYDPSSEGWIVVWVGGTDPIEPSSGSTEVRAKRIARIGAPFSSYVPVSLLGHTGEANASVFVGESRTGGSSTTFALVVWDELVNGRRSVWARNLAFTSQSGGLGFIDQPFRIDAGPELPATRDSSNARVSTNAPLDFLTPTFERSAPRIAFEVRSGGQTDIFVASVLGSAVKVARRLTDTPAVSEARPDLDWNATSGRTLVLFDRPSGGGRVFGRYLRSEDATSNLALYGPEFDSGAGIRPHVEAFPRDDRFYVTSGVSLLAVAGLRTNGNPGGASPPDFAAFAMTPAGQPFLVWRHPDGPTATSIDGLHFGGLQVEENDAPIAQAGVDIEVVEGSLFRLDGTQSRDPDLDRILYRWTQVGSGESLFTSESERERAEPSLRAPLLTAPYDPVTYTFELAVDDFRSEPPFPSVDTVRVTVVPGEDPHPPVANAGSDRTVDEDTVVTLDGSASDPDGEPVDFLWEVLSVTPGSVSIAISDPSNPRATLQTPRFSGKDGIRVELRLRAASRRGGTDEDTVTIQIRDSVNESPVAEAVGPSSVEEGVSFVLDASGSEDPNDDELSFSWVIVSEPHRSGDVVEEIELSDPSAPSPSVVASIFDDRDLEFRVTVDDGRGGEDAASVIVRVTRKPMEVTNVTPRVGSPGDPVNIFGSNLYAQGTKVYIGQIDEEHRLSIDSIGHNVIRARIPSGPPSLRSVYVPKLGTVRIFEHTSIETGPIIVVQEDAEYTSPQPFEVKHSRVSDVILTQGLESYDLVRRKDTLFQVRMEALPGLTVPLPRLDEARLHLFPIGGDYIEIEGVVPNAVVPSGTVLTAINQAVNFFVPGEDVDAERFRFRATITNGGEEIARVETETDSAVFTKVWSPRILFVPVVPFTADGKPFFNEADLVARMEKSVETFRRVMPFPDTEFVIWPHWEKMESLRDDNGMIKLEQFSLGRMFDGIGAFNELADKFSCWNEENPNQRADFVVAFIDKSLAAPGSAGGLAVAPYGMMADIAKFWVTYHLDLGPVPPLDNLVIDVLDLLGDAVCTLSLGLLCPDPVEIVIDFVLGVMDLIGIDVSSRVSFVFATDDPGQILAQEIGHNMGYVNPYSHNHDLYNISHSRFDEDEADLTFFDAPLVGDEAINVVPPGMLFRRGGALAKSVMSYAPLQTDANTFLEPRDYNKIVRVARTRAILDPIADRVRAIAAVADSPKVRVIGTISIPSHEARIQEVRPAPEAAGETPYGGSPLVLTFRDAGGAALSESSFPATLHLPIHKHPSPPGDEHGLAAGDGGAHHAPGEHDGENDADEGPVEHAILSFHVVRGLPSGARSLELRYRDEVVWTKTIGENAPSVTLLVPAGGELLDEDAVFEIEWSATDADGDPLTYSVWYSRDDGESWVPLASELDETTLEWTSAAAPGTDSARIKVIASDGFQSDEAVSERFRVAEKTPTIAIRRPANGTDLISSELVDLRGAAHAVGDGELDDDSIYTWSSSQDGVLGSGRRLIVFGLTAGTHELRLEAEVDGGTIAATITVNVLADTDGDGIPDEVEAAHPALDPEDGEDAFRDDDGDGIATGSEVVDFGTNPTNADTDGDGIPDGDEVAAGQSATSADTDGDGIADGSDNCARVPNPDQTDTDGDGAGDACPLPWTLELRAGPNLVHLPLTEANQTAYARIDTFGGPEVVLEIARWNAEEATFQSVTVTEDGLAGDDFAIDELDGLLVRLREDRTVEQTSAPRCDALELSPGRNLVAIPCRPEGSTVFEYLAEKGAALGVTSVERQVPGVEGELEIATLEEGVPTGVDFPIRRGEAYWVVTGDDEPATSTFRRGDSNASGAVDLSDAVTILNWLFSGGVEPTCPDAADANDDGKRDLSDAVSILNWLFLGGQAPAPPGAEVCGEDPTEDSLPACSYESC